MLCITTTPIGKSILYVNEYGLMWGGGGGGGKGGKGESKYCYIIYSTGQYIWSCFIFIRDMLYD